MTLQLTDEQRRALKNQTDKPIRVVDEETNTTFVLLPADLYERVNALFEDDPLSENVRRVILQGVWQRAHWDDPAMDDYAALDPRKKP
jgi:hypothetical protein